MKPRYFVTVNGSKARRRYYPSAHQATLVAVGQVIENTVPHALVYLCSAGGERLIADVSATFHKTIITHY